MIFDTKVVDNINFELKQKLETKAKKLFKFLEVSLPNIKFNDDIQYDLYSYNAFKKWIKSWDKGLFIHIQANVSCRIYYGDDKSADVFEFLKTEKFIQFFKSFKNEFFDYGFERGHIELEFVNPRAGKNDVYILYDRYTELQGADNNDDKTEKFDKKSQLKNAIKDLLKLKTYLPDKNNSIKQHPSITYGKLRKNEQKILDFISQKYGLSSYDIIDFYFENVDTVTHSLKQKNNGLTPDKESIKSLVLSRLPRFIYKVVKNIPVKFRSSIGDADGFYNPNSREITIDKDIDKISLLGTLAHEYWHAFEHISGFKNNTKQLFNKTMKDWDTKNTTSVTEDLIQIVNIYLTFGKNNRLLKTLKDFRNRWLHGDKDYFNTVQYSVFNELKNELQNDALFSSMQEILAETLKSIVIQEPINDITEGFVTWLNSKFSSDDFGFKKLAKFLYASVLQLDSGTIDHEKTNIAKKIKKFTARTNGNLNDSLMSACFYATKKGYLDGNNHEMYVYQGNSYMQSVWRVTWKKSEALNPINNTGLGLYTVTPDLTITYYTIPDRVKKRKEMDKSLKKLDKKSSSVITEKDIPVAMNHWSVDRDVKWYGEWFLKSENESELKQALILWNDIDKKIKSIIGKINFDKNDLIRQILGAYNSEKLDDDNSINAFFPIPIYVSASNNDKNTVGLMIHYDGKIEMFEGNDESTPETTMIVNKLLSGGKPILKKIWAMHTDDLVEKIKRTKKIPKGIFVSPVRSYAEGYWSTTQNRILFSGIVDANDFQQDSDYDWKAISDAKIDKISIY